MLDPRHPSATFADLFRVPTHDLVDHHHPGQVRFTWNARGALFQLLNAKPDRSGATVLVPAFHCLAIVKPILAAGFKVACYRIRRDFTIDLDDLAARMRDDVAAVVVIHYFGFPTRLDDALSLARARGALLIEDCSHSFLTRHDGRWLGQHGDYSVFSYYKCVPSLIGGALLANGGLPLPEIPGCRAPWLAQLAVIRSLLKQADANAPERSWRAIPRALGKHAIRTLARRIRRPEPESDEGTGVARLDECLDDPYLFDASLAPAGLPAFAQRIIEASPWKEIAKIRRRHYATWSELLPDSAIFQRPLPDLPEGVVPCLFPILLRDRWRHDTALRAAEVPYLRFGIDLHATVENAGETARADARYLSESLMLLPVHQNLDESMIREFGERLLHLAEHLSSRRC